ncbi:actin-related 10 [Brachionus plicatilis]|uniref:Actin-related 10 n=1 Tax=Brachionus plicatilis TaxID=10195 RepID=A0A3M7PX74_BRAPC|nr:actin-related 10 [Brachionus plicatilis]
MNFFEPFADKPAIVVDIGQAYTKCGFAGEPAPHAIIPTQVTLNSECQSLFTYKLLPHGLETLKEMLIEFFYNIYYKILNANSRERKVVIVESILTASEFRHTLADVLFNDFHAISVLCIPTHLACTYTLGISRAMVVDFGYNDCQLMPISDGYSLTNLCSFAKLGAQHLHEHLKALIEKYAMVTLGGEKVLFSSLSSRPALTESVLEDIKLKCCFVTSFDRAQKIYQEMELKKTDSFAGLEFEFAPDCDYNLDSLIMHIPGQVREMACEIFFKNEIDPDQCLQHLILDTLSKAPMDLKREFASNVVLAGGGCMLDGLKPRLVKEINFLLQKCPSVFSAQKLSYHKSPSHENYTAWLGAAIFGSLDVLDFYSIQNSRYKELKKLPDWFTIEIRNNLVQI